jgi:spoIIIJ-associated protein
MEGAMSPFIEFEGKNVELAVTRACKVLNVPRDQLKHDVISFGATGIFGLVGIKKARIRVLAPGIQNAETAAPVTETRPMRTDAPAVLPAFAETQNPDTVCPAPQPPLPEDLAALGRQVLQRLVDSVACGAEIMVNCSSRQIVYTISGGDPATLIGKKGQTLEAIQYLLKKIVNKSAEDRVRILVDIAGYASKRKNELQALALQFAEKACLNGKSVTIGRFNPQDRKIIHLALKNDRRVKTQSKGEGYVKKLAVIPRGK